MEIATFSGIATTTGDDSNDWRSQRNDFRTTATIAFGAGIVTIGKRRMIGGRAFVPMKTEARGASRDE